MTSHRRKSLTMNMRQLRDKKRTSPRGRKKLDFNNMSKQQLPLYNKSIYMDVKHGKHADLMEEQLKKLGARIEKFLSREVNYVISSSGPSKTDERQGSWDDNPQSPSFGSVPSPFSCGPSPSGQTESKKAVVSRGKTLAQIACAKNKVSTVVANAEKLGIKVVSVEVANKWLERELKKIETECKTDKDKIENKLVKTKPLKKENNAKSKTLKSSFIKFEASNQHYKPLKSELGKWPRLNLSAPPGICPFGEAKLKVQHQFGARKTCPPQDNVANAGIIAVEEASVTEEIWLAQAPPAVPELVGVPIVTTGDVKRNLNMGFKKNANINKQQGYCDCCEVKFKDINKHVTGDEHRAFARDKKNYESLDALISEVPSTIKFLQSVLLKHCVQKQSEPAGDSNCPSGSFFSIAQPISPLVTEKTGLQSKDIAALSLNTPQPFPVVSPSKDQLLLTDTDLVSKKETSPTDEEDKDDNRPQAVVIRRPVPSGIFTSPRRRQPTPSKKIWVQERSMIFRDSPLASLQPSCSSNQSFAFRDVSGEGSLGTNTSNFLRSPKLCNGKQSKATDSHGSSKRIIDFSEKSSRPPEETHGETCTDAELGKAVNNRKADSVSGQGVEVTAKAQEEIGCTDTDLKISKANIENSCQESSEITRGPIQKSAHMKAENDNTASCPKHLLVENKTNDRSIKCKDKPSPTLESVQHHSDGAATLCDTHKKSGNKEETPHISHSSSELLASVEQVVKDGSKGLLLRDESGGSELGNRINAGKSPVHSHGLHLENKGENVPSIGDKMEREQTDQSRLHLISNSHSDLGGQVVPCIADRVKCRSRPSGEKALDRSGDQDSNHIKTANIASSDNISEVAVNITHACNNFSAKRNISTLREQLAVVRKRRSRKKSSQDIDITRQNEVTSHGHLGSEVNSDLAEVLMNSDTNTGVNGYERDREFAIMRKQQSEKDFTGQIDVKESDLDSAGCQSSQVNPSLSNAPRYSTGSTKLISLSSSKESAVRRKARSRRDNVKRGDDTVKSHDIHGYSGTEAYIGSNCVLENEDDGRAVHQHRGQSLPANMKEHMKENDCNPSLKLLGISETAVSSQIATDCSSAHAAATPSTRQNEIQASEIATSPENITHVVKQQSRSCKLFTHEGMYANDGERYENPVMKGSQENMLTKPITTANMAVHRKRDRKSLQLSEHLTNDGDAEKTNLGKEKMRDRERRRMKRFAKAHKDKKDSSQSKKKLDRKGKEEEDSKHASQHRERNGGKDKVNEESNRIVPNIAENVKRRRSCTMFNHEGQYANSGEGSNSEDIDKGTEKNYITKSISKFQSKHYDVQKQSSCSKDEKDTQKVLMCQHTGSEMERSSGNTEVIPKEEEAVTTSNRKKKFSPTEDVISGERSAVVIRRRKSAVYSGFSRKPRHEADWGKFHTSKDWSIHEDEESDENRGITEESQLKNESFYKAQEIHELPSINKCSSPCEEGRTKNDIEMVSQQKVVETHSGVSPKQRDSSSSGIHQAASDKLIHKSKHKSINQELKSKQIQKSTNMKGKSSLAISNSPRLKLKIFKDTNSEIYSSTLEEFHDDGGSEILTGTDPNNISDNRSDTQGNLCIAKSTKATQREAQNCTPGKRQHLSDCESVDLLPSSSRTPKTMKSKGHGKSDYVSESESQSVRLLESPSCTSRSKRTKSKKSAVENEVDVSSLVALQREIKDENHPSFQNVHVDCCTTSDLPEHEAKAQSPSMPCETQSPRFSSPVSSRHAKSQSKKKVKEVTSHSSQASSECRSPIFKMSRKNLKHMQDAQDAPSLHEVCHEPDSCRNDGQSLVTLRDAGLEANVTVDCNKEPSLADCDRKATRETKSDCNFSKRSCRSADSISPPSAKRIKVEEHWRLASDRSMAKLLESEQDSAPFDGFQDSSAPSVHSDMTFVEVSEISLESTEDAEWIVTMKEDGEEYLSDQSEKGKLDDGSDSEPQDFLTFIPTFSSPGKATDSSWGDVCESYLSTSIHKHSQRSPRLGTPRKSPRSKQEKNLLSPFKIPDHYSSPNRREIASRYNTKATDVSSTPDKEKQKHRKSSSKRASTSRKHKVRTPDDADINVVHQGFSTPVKSHHKSCLELSPGIRRVDKVISFNYMSPQRMNSSPLSIEAIRETGSPMKRSLFNHSKDPSKSEAICHSNPPKETTAQVGSPNRGKAESVIDPQTNKRRKSK